MLVLITVFSGLMRGRFGDASYYITEIKQKEPRNHGTLLFGNAYKNTYKRPGRDSNPRPMA